jgi:beta-lactamase regulating signal transducer with metallopeptidase domain
MNAMEMLTGPFAQAIGWALLHLVWQATIVAGILAAVLALLPRESANARYAAACSALAFVFAMFVTTAIRSYDPAAAPVQTSSFEGSTVNVPLTKIPAVIVATAAASWRDRAVDAMSTARQSLPTVVAFWFLGVLVLSTRLMVSWFRARALLTHGATDASSEWQSVAARLSEALGLRRAVRLLQSAAVEVPSVLGTLRPVILLPASTLTGLTPAQLEMVLAHELAHIARHDFLVNLLQAFVETLMFYHPAVWWMSRRVRIERENCCDDLAVAVCGNPLQYAKALTRLEELRANALPTVVAANGGSLLDRIRRIAAGRAESTGTGTRWGAAAAMLAILAIALIVPSLPALAQRDEPGKAATSNIDVVEPAEEPDDPPEPRKPADPAEPAEEPDFDFNFDSEFVMVPPIPPIPPVVVPNHIFVPPIPPVPPVNLAFLNNFGHFRNDDNDDDADRDQHEQSRDGKLSVDDLIALRATGVTPEYIKEMRSLFPGSDLGDVTGMSAVGVTPEYVRELRAAGLDLDASDVTGLKAVGVTSDYVKQMRDAGFTIKDAGDVTGLKALGITGAWIRDMRTAGLTIESADDASGLKALGVTAEYIKGLRDAGFTIKDADDVTGMKAVGVTVDYVREMAEAGVKIVDADDATSLKAVGVTPQFVKQLAAAGYTNLSIDELTSMAATGINSDFVRDMQQYRDHKN